MSEPTTEETTEEELNYVLNPIEKDKVDEETGELVLDDDGNPVREVISATPEVVYVEEPALVVAEAEEEAAEEEPAEEEPSY